MTVKCMISYYAVTNDLTFIFQKHYAPKFEIWGTNFFSAPIENSLSLSLSLSLFVSCFLTSIQPGHSHLGYWLTRQN